MSRPIEACARVESCAHLPGAKSSNIDHPIVQIYSVPGRAGKMSQFRVTETSVAEFC